VVINYSEWSLRDGCGSVGEEDRKNRKLRERKLFNRFSVGSELGHAVLDDVADSEHVKGLWVRLFTCFSPRPPPATA